MPTRRGLGSTGAIGKDEISAANAGNDRLVALKTPRLFDGYIIVSPSLWYDNYLIVTEKRRLAPTVRELPFHGLPKPFAPTPCA